MPVGDGEGGVVVVEAGAGSVLGAQTHAAVLRLGLVLVGALGTL